MKLDKGLWLDSSKTNQPSGTWKHLLNGVFDIDKGVITEEKGFRKFSKSYPAGKTCIGAVTLDDEIILFSVNDANESTSEIGILAQNGKYSKFIGGTLLNFNYSFSIKAKAIRNFNLNRIVTFIDENNTPKVINLDNLIYTLDANSDLAEANINNYEMFPSSKEPLITNTKVSSGGNLLSGTYYVILQHETEYGMTSAWTKKSIPFYVSASGDSAVLGSASNQISSRRIELTLNNVDTRFSKLNIGVISEIEGVESVKLFSTINISSTVEVVKIGSNNGTILSFEEVLTNKSNYIRIKDIELTEDQLLGANVTEDEEINFQQYANMINVDYVKTDVSTVLSEISKGIVQDTGADKGFRSGEVYSLYCTAMLTKGGESRAFHVPGRPAVTGETDDSQYAGGQVASGTKKYQVEDTADSVSTVSNLGFWENQSETYPNTSDYDSSSLGGLDLRGEKVRHHRMPSLRKIHAGTSLTGTSVMPRLKFSFSNIVIPAHLVDKISGIKFYYVKRTIENMTCIGQSLYQYNHIDVSTGSFSSQSFIGNFYGSTGAVINFPFTGTLKFYDFALSSSQPLINPTYISNQVKLTKDMKALETGASWGELENDYAQTAKERILGLNYTNPSTTGNGAVPDSSYIRDVESYKYVPHNVNLSDIENKYADNYVDVRVDSTSLDINNAAVNPLNYYEYGWETGTSILNEETYITDLNVLLDDVYFNISQDKELVSMSKTSGQYLSITSAGTKTFTSVGNGDSFINWTSMTRLSVSGYSTIYDPEVEDEYVNKCIKYYSAESVQNMRMRYPVSSEPNTENLSDGLDSNGQEALIRSFKVQQPVNIYYSTDFNQLNDGVNLLTYNPEVLFSGKHPYRIIRSDTISREANNLIFNFAPLSYYEMPKTRGEVVGLDAIKDKLVIRHRQGTYVTRSKQKIVTDGGDATVGQNDLFEIEPQELYTTDQGFVKSKGVFDSLSTENGLIIVDRQEGKLFIVGGEGVMELTSPDSGVKHFLLEEFKSLEDAYHLTFYTSASNSIQIENGRWVFKIDNGILPAPIENFKVGDYIQFGDIYCKITSLRTENEYTVISTDYRNSVTVTTAIVHRRIIDSPHFQFGNGVILGWNKDIDTLFLTKRQRFGIPKDKEDRFIGVDTGIDTSELNVGDIVRRSDLEEWNGSTFNIIGSVDRSLTLSFNFSLKRWISFHSYIPNIYLNQNDRLLSFDDNVYEIYKHNQIGRRGKYYNETPVRFEIEIIFNNGNNITKKFNTLKWSSPFRDSDDVLQEDLTFTDIQVSNDKDDLGVVNLVVYQDLSNKGNVRSVQGTWHFNKLKNPSNKDLTDKYLSVILRYSSDNSLYLYDVSSSFKLLDKNG